MFTGSFATFFSTSLRVCGFPGIRSTWRHVFSGNLPWKLPSWSFTWETVNSIPWFFIGRERIPTLLKFSFPVPFCGITLSYRRKNETGIAFGKLDGWSGKSRFPLLSLVSLRIRTYLFFSHGDENTGYVNFNGKTRNRGPLFPQGSPLTDFLLSQTHVSLMISAL